MTYKRIIGIICILIGIGMLGFGFHVKNEMASARAEIRAAQPDKGLIPDTPLTDPIKKSATEEVKRGYYARVDEYEPLKNFLFIGGGIFLLGGIILVIFGKKKKS